MKDVAKKALGGNTLNTKELYFEVIRQAFLALVAFFTARGEILGGMCPFGISLASAIHPQGLAMVALGSFFGYLSGMGLSDSFRYLAGLFAVVAIKALLAALTKYSAKPLLCAVIAGVTSCATAAVNFAGDDGKLGLIFAETVLSSAAAYFFAKGFACLKYPTATPSSQELACLLISLNVVFIGLMSLVPFGISLGFVLCSVFILLAARYGRVYASTVCAVAASFAAALSGEGMSAAIGFSVAGLITGIFASFGKYATVLSYILSFTVAGAVGLDSTTTVEMLIASLFGGAIFLCFPRTAATYIGKLFSPPAKTMSENSMKKALTMRLGFAAGALSDVSQTVETVAKELSKINTPDFESVLKGIERDACAGCSLAVNCWESRQSETVDSVLEIIKEVKEGVSTDQAQKENSAPSRCMRPQKFKEAIRRHYADYAAHIAAESRLSDVRCVVTEQFDGISKMLYDMATELDCDETFDERTAVKISEALKNIDITAEECGCRIDKYGRMTLEIIAPKIKGMSYNKMRLLRQIELCCERDFEPPAITETSQKVYITLTERATIMLDTGVCQIASSPSGICGDAYSIFSDGKGRSFLIVSDGMGTGGRAAVDSAMASGLMTRLLKAGFGADCSLSILNSAMLFKSTDESLATVDIICIDLYSGRTDMLKCGAAPSVIKRSGRCSIAKSTSLPAGILREVGFDKATVKLKGRDIIVMMSDGVCGEGTDWICTEIEAATNTTAASLAEKIAYGAKRRRSDGHEDDITVVVAIVEKAP